MDLEVGQLGVVIFSPLFLRLPGLAPSLNRGSVRRGGCAWSACEGEPGTGTALGNYVGGHRGPLTVRLLENVAQFSLSPGT